MNNNKNIELKLLGIRILFKEENKKGSAFIEFETSEIAKKVLKEYNGKKVNNFVLLLNWTKLNKKKVNIHPQKIYTVRNRYNIKYSYI